MKCKLCKKRESNNQICKICSKRIVDLVLDPGVQKWAPIPKEYKSIHKCKKCGKEARVFGMFKGGIAFLCKICATVEEL